MSTDFQDPENASRRRGTDPTLEIIMHDVRRSREEIGNLREGLAQMAEAITKLAIVEERQATDKAALERAFMAIQKTDERTSLLIEKMDNRIDEVAERVTGLEAKAPQAAQIHSWVTAAVWAAASLGCYLLLHKIGVV